MDENNINVQNKQQPSNGIATAGCIVSMVSIVFPISGITGLVGLILSIVGVVKSKKLNGKGKGFAITGIVIGVIGIIYGIYSFI